MSRLVPFVPFKPIVPFLLFVPFVPFVPIVPLVPIVPIMLADAVTKNVSAAINFNTLYCPLPPFCLVSDLLPDDHVK